MSAGNPLLRKLVGFQVGDRVRFTDKLCGGPSEDFQRSCRFVVVSIKKLEHTYRDTSVFVTLELVSYAAESESESGFGFGHIKIGDVFGYHEENIELAND